MSAPAGAPAELVHLSDVEPRFGDWGPGYLVQADDVTFGVVTLRPGDAFDNHRHEQHTESFLVLEGSSELWLDRSELILLEVGTLFRCLPGVDHYLRNVGPVTFRAFFIKSPGVSGDKIETAWTPEEGTT